MASGAPTLVEITGALLLGYIFNAGLYGALVVQVYLYYISFPKDHTRSKAVVYGLFLIETVQVVLNMSDVFNLFALGWGDSQNLDNIHLAWLAVPILTGLVSFIVQCFYGYRIYLLTAHPWVPGLIGLLALTQFSGAFVGGVQVYLGGHFSEIEASRTASTIWLAGSAACDVLIAVTMTRHLWQSETGLRSTHIMLTKVIRLVVETGSITAGVAVTDLLLFLIFPHQTFHTVPAQCLAKLYSNSVLVLFNSRIKVRGGREEGSRAPEDLEMPYVTTALKFNHHLHDATTTTSTQTRLGTHRMTVSVDRTPWGEMDRRSVHSPTSQQPDANDTIAVRNNDEFTRKRLSIVSIS